MCRVAGGSARFRKIAAAGANLVAVVVGEFDFYFVVAAVGNKIGGAVGDGVLIAKLLWRKTNRTSGPQGPNLRNRRMRTRLYGGVAGADG